MSLNGLASCEIRAAKDGGYIVYPTGFTDPTPYAQFAGTLADCLSYVSVEFKAARAKQRAAKS